MENISSDFNIYENYALFCSSITINLGNKTSLQVITIEHYERRIPTTKDTYLLSSVKKEISAVFGKNSKKKFKIHIYLLKHHTGIFKYLVR